jgi:acetylornithine deacetylase/succinyl-diaminopimelate desuccinylase-like protein
MLDLLARSGVNSVDELAESTGIRECLQWLTRERKWINEQHLRVARIPAPTFFEQERAKWMSDQFRALGCEVTVDGAGNVAARPRGTISGSLVVVSAHLDTVLAPRKPEDVVVEADGRMLGPGVADNSSGLAALLAIAGALQPSPPLRDCHRGLLLLATVCEEGEGNLNGMRHFYEESPLGARAEACLVLDGPSTDHITSTALESRRFEVTFNGPGGHSWSDFGVGNPVHALARAVAFFLAERAANQVPTGTPGSYNFAYIEGGTTVNSIPSAARMKVDLRSESGAAVEELMDLLKVAVEKGTTAENAAARSGPVASRILAIGSRPGGRLPDEAPILELLRAVDAHLGIRSHLDCASTDANIPLSRGVQSVSIGAGGQGGGAHTPLEWYHPRGRDLGLKRILLATALLMRDVSLTTDYH